MQKNTFTLTACLVMLLAASLHSRKQLPHVNALSTSSLSIPQDDDYTIFKHFLIIKESSYFLASGPFNKEEETILARYGQ